jgi:predicted secreted protein
MATVKIDESSAGSTVQLAIGDQAQLILPETRTAGFSWKVVSKQSPAFRLQDGGFSRAGGVGGSGVHRWTITGMETGSAALELAYGRSWESGVGKRFAITISVA